jgi:outer membrane scaffolding protein for murein synthesis (MipA/OmpV family)
MTMAAALRLPLRLTRGMALRPAARAVLLGALAAVTASAAAAQDPAVGDSPRAQIEVLGGVSISPSYFGSDEYDAGPLLRPRFDYVRLPGGLEFGSVDAPGEQQGFGLRTSARYIGSRRPDDHPSLAGTDRIDSSIEVGLGIGYTADDWRAFGVMRYGVIGHNAWVGEAGADALFSPTDTLLINIGPRANWGQRPLHGHLFRGQCGRGRGGAAARRVLAAIGALFGRHGSRRPVCLLAAVGGRGRGDL